MLAGFCGVVSGTVPGTTPRETAKKIRWGGGTCTGCPHNPGAAVAPGGLVGSPWYTGHGDKTRATGQPIKDAREHLHIVVLTRSGQPGRVDGRGLLQVGAVNHGAPWQTTQNHKTIHTTAPGQNGAPGERLTRYKNAVPTPKQPPRVWLVVTQTQHGAGVSRFPWLRFPPVLGGGCVFWSLVTVPGFPGFRQQWPGLFRQQSPGAVYPTRETGGGVDGTSGKPPRHNIPLYRLHFTVSRVSRFPCFKLQNTGHGNAGRVVTTCPGCPVQWRKNQKMQG